MSVRFAPTAAAAIVVISASRSAVTLKPSHAPTRAPPTAAAKPIDFVRADQSRRTQAK